MEVSEIESLLVRYFNEELSPSEAEKVSSWMAENDENRKTAEHIYIIWYSPRKPNACTAR